MDFNKVFHRAEEGITKEQFLEAYNKFPPSGFVKFAFKYFSKSTKPEDKWLKNTFVGVEITLFLLGMLGTILNWSKLAVAIPTIIFSLLLLFLVVYLFTAAMICNNLRIRKIRKELGGISKWEYESLVNKYLD